MSSGPVGFRGSRQGVFYGRDQDGRELMVRQQVRVDSRGCRTEVAQVEHDPSPVVVESQDRRVVLHCQRVELAIRRKQYGARPIQSRWKERPAPAPEPLPPIGQQWCPRCREAGEVSVLCGICDGEGLVSDRRAQELRELES